MDSKNSEKSSFLTHSGSESKISRSTNNGSGTSGRRRGVSFCICVALAAVCVGSVVAIWLSFPLFWTQRNVSMDMCAGQPIFSPDMSDVLGDISRYPKFNLSDPMVVKYALQVEEYFGPWKPIKGVKSGLGTTGMVTPNSLRHVGRLWLFMACCGHVKLIKGKLFYRYGGFYTVWYRLLRFLQSLQMIQDAVDQYGLHDLTLEFYVNTCDHPMSFFSSHWAGRAGFPVMSTVFTVDTFDIPIPDPLDLTEAYTPDLSLQVPWERKEARAVFRGSTTNFELKDGNWGSNPRLRLHRMSEAFPELMDTRINRWSHIKGDALLAIEQDGFFLARGMNFSQFNAFKYQVVVDGGGGSCRTCGVLRSNQLTIRQDTPMKQFYEPVMEDYMHVLATHRTFEDLPDRVRWAQQNDEVVKEIVRNANLLADYACTWHGRTLYWAVVLVKYQKALTSPELITEPTNICSGSPILEPPGDKPPLVKCTDPKMESLQDSPCSFFCISSPMPEDKFVWLRGESVRSLPRIGPP
eukprot:TRINITY_DN5588_c0_g1_i1.p1 TRINITY_DN5588_c0_g1~~TRINITY_DN5588_c0_g1_i1.p1  ORF type:complete len:521 (-),score=96.89 TRINITY_DN5588_c0_g1_i1:94-1656(-)